MRRIAIVLISLAAACCGCGDDEAYRLRMRDEWVASEKAKIEAGNERLFFYETVNTSHLLRELSGHRNVQEIAFENTQDLDETGFDELSKFPNLRELSFFREKALDSRTIRYVAACDGLEELSVDGTNLDSEGIRTIATIETLKRLTLRPNSVEKFAEDDVLSLAALTNLEYLYLGGASPEAIEKLRKELLDCEVVDADSGARETGESRFYESSGTTP